MIMVMVVIMSLLLLEASIQALKTNPDANSACLVKVFVIDSNLTIGIGTRKLSTIWHDVRAMSVALTNFQKLCGTRINVAFCFTGTEEDQH